MSERGMDIKMKDVIVILGPTGSGKSAVAVEVAKQIDGEVISADSMQIYKEMNIGTAKITEPEMKGIPHHLVDILSLDKTFSVFDYKNLAISIINDIIIRNRCPIVCGGTGLYIDSLIKNIQFDEHEVDHNYRNEMYSLANEKGNDILHNILRECDPVAADKIHPNNIKAIVRALEVCYLSNNSFSNVKKQAIMHKPEFSFHLYGLSFQRKNLYDRINKRVDKMFDDGLLQEVTALYRSGKLSSDTARQAIGYKELLKHVDGTTDEDCTLQETIDKIKQGTRRYAKRQLTWFRRDPNIHWIDCEEKSVEEIAKFISHDVCN